MNFNIEWVENKTSSKGTNYKLLTLVDTDGKKFNDVAVFERHPEYAKCEPGRAISGVLENKPYNGKDSWSIKPELQAPAFVAGRQAMSNIVKEKNENISKAMDKKADGIMVSSTARDATAILTTLYPQATDWQEKWLEIRHWLVENWDNTEKIL